MVDVHGEKHQLSFHSCARKKQQTTPMLLAQHTFRILLVILSVWIIFSVSLLLPQQSPSSLPPKAIKATLPIFSTFPTDCTEKFGPSENRRVYTYYQSIPNFRDDLEMIEIWKANWRQHCWEPIVLNVTHAMNHESYESFLANVTRLPTVNSKAYEISCYVRYLAMAVVGGGIMVDNDMINIDFKPSDMTIPLPERFSCYDQFIPSMVYGSKAEFERIASYMSHYQLRSDDQSDGRTHTSDMLILRRMLKENLVDEVKNSPVKTGKLNHLSSHWTKMVNQYVDVDIDKKNLFRLALLFKHGMQT